MNKNHIYWIVGIVVVIALIGAYVTSKIDPVATSPTTTPITASDSTDIINVENTDFSLDKYQEVDQETVIEEFYETYGTRFSSVQTEHANITIEGREEYADLSISDEIDAYINEFAESTFATSYALNYAGTIVEGTYLQSRVEDIFKYNGYTSVRIHLVENTGGAHGNPWTYTIVEDPTGNKVELSQYINGKVTEVELIKRINEKIDVYESTEPLENIIEIQDDENWLITENGDIQFIFDVYRIASFAQGPVPITVNIN